jgi:hypothetical protein
MKREEEVVSVGLQLAFICASVVGVRLTMVGSVVVFGRFKV